MATINEEIIVDVDLEKVVPQLLEVQKRVAELSEENKKLKATIKDNGDATGAYTMALSNNEKTLQLLKGQQQAYVGQLQANYKANVELGDSYNELNSRLNQLQKQYKGLTQAQRESEEGKALLKQIAEQKQALKDIDATMGDYQRNVGNYAGSLSPYFSKLNGTLTKFGTSLEDIGKNGLASMKTGFANLGKSVVTFGKLLITTPLGWLLAVVGAIIIVFDKLKEAFRKSDEAGTDLATAMANLKPVMILINKLFETWALVLGKVVLAVSNVVQVIVGELIPAYKATAEASQELVLAKDKLEQKEREYTVNSANRSKEISELRAKALDKEKYSAKEREELLSKAIELEKQNLEDEKKIKAEHVRIIKEKAKQDADTSDATTNKIAQAEADLINAETNYNNGTRRLQKELLTAKKENNDEQKKLIDERIEKEKEALEEEKRLNAERVALYDELTKELEDAVIANMQEGLEKQLAERKVAYERDVQAIKDKYNERLGTEEEYQQLLKEKELQYTNDVAQLKLDAETDAENIRKERLATIRAEWQKLDDERNVGDFEYQMQRRREQFEIEQEQLREQLTEKGELTAEEQAEINTLLLEQQKAYEEESVRLTEENKQKQADIRQATAKQALSAFGNVLSSMSSLVSAFDAQSEESARASKAIALGRIAIETGVAIAQGISTATRSSATWIDQLVAIATTVATVGANMANAIATVKSAKFAEGGIVDGVSYEGDKVPARLNSREMVLNLDQQKQLFDIANGRSGSSGIDYEALAIAMSQTPPPILDYREFTTFGQKVTQLNELATL